MASHGSPTSGSTDPDGDGINENGIYLVRPDGRDKHLLLTVPAGHPDWSPDGKRLAVDTEPADGDARSGPWTRTGRTAAGRHLRWRACAGPPAPAWSPDGRHLAFKRVPPA